MQDPGVNPSNSARDEREHHQSLQDALSMAGSQLRRRENGEVDVMHAVGGVRGLVEALLPGFLFLTVYLVSESLYVSLAVAGAVALVFAAVRLVQRGKLVQSVSGFVGVLICAVVALRTGDAADYYVPGLWINLAYGLGVLLSIIVRWPILGLIYSFIRDEVGTWRTVPGRLKAYQKATWVLFAMFVVRLLVQVPLYLADHVAGLGAARLLMGTPLYAAVLWVTWMMTRKPADVLAEERS
ncbi:DUF3159 domain-containing protein [Rothia aerolata]|uniref:DUF3159 domain-containing protein n=1 Tax=Rothia aerolata TaxID=1812262 RepID=A0A917IM42_9MICC|nr:DUF3159 domain-containing protein [Rothia aerolata]GGH56785.1 hypothetical protein GCM10007359_01250 [Rothia aerolata]